VYSVVSGNNELLETVTRLVSPPPPPPPPPLTPEACTDCDGDGYPARVDCVDTNASIHPGATDVPGNNPRRGLQRPCGTLPAVELGDHLRHRVPRRRTISCELHVRPAHAGSIVRVRCSGRGCLFKLKTRRIRRRTADLDLSSIVRRSKLRPSSGLEVQVTKPGTIGIVRRLTVRAGKPPLRRDRCLTPRAKQPARCAL